MRSALIDTNLLLLLIVGLNDKKLISKHKRTKNFIPEDFDLLSEVLSGYEELWVTSHCFAEVSNLIKQTNEKQAKELMAYLSIFATKTKESHIPKEIIFENKMLPRLGVADTGILVKAKRVNCVITVDLNLYIEILKKGYKVINFNHLRTEIFLT